MDSKEIKDKTIAMRSGKLKLEHDGEYWSDDEHRKLTIMFEGGDPLNEIAIELGRSETAVYQKIEQMQLYAKTTRKHRKQYIPPEKSGCLCQFCKADRSECPHCSNYHSMKEEV